MVKSQPIHLVTGGAAAGAVSELIELKGAGTLMALHDPLSYGPLSAYGTPDGIKSRRNWLREAFISLEDAEWQEFIEPHIGLPQLTPTLDGSVEYVIWCGRQADDQLMLRAVCAFFPDHKLNVADVTGFWPDGDGRCAVGACSPHDLKEVSFTAIPSARRAELAAEWRHLSDHGGLVRTFLDGTIKLHDSNVFDAALIFATDAVFQEAGRIISRVMRQYPLQASDTYLAYRLQILVKKGLLRAETGIEPYRMRVCRN